MNKSNIPLCQYDLIECNIVYENCEYCPRYCHGVSATGAMPNLERTLNWVNKLFKHINNSHKSTKNVKTS